MTHVVRTLAFPAIIVLAIVAVAGPVSAATPKVKLKPILPGYDRPLLVTNDGGRNRALYIVEQPGIIKRAKYSNGIWKKAGTFLDISDRVAAPPQGEGGDFGLLGLAFHPNYARNGRFYVLYTRDIAEPGYRDPVIAEYRRKNRTEADRGSERIVMVIDEPIDHHHAGHLAFGPDGRLYLSLGDGDDPDNAQDLGTLLGSILRIDPRDPDGKGPKTYSVPGGNPYVGKPGKRNQIWSHGLRNPWRYSFDRKTGYLWIGDVGEDTREEVDRAKSNGAGRAAGRGKNYGWPDCEGFLEYASDESDPDDLCSSHTLPLYDYDVMRGGAWCSVTGGFVHRGPRSRSWHGLYVAGDFCGGLFVLDKKGRLRYSRKTDKRVSSFGEDAAGRLFATAFDGNVYKVILKGPRP